MRTAWNDLEDDALQGLPLRAQIIYLRGIRRYMDYATGIAGTSKRRISLKMLGEIAHEEVNRKLQDTPTKDCVRASIEQLKRAGLIERIEDKDYLIFFLPKADTHNSMQNNNPTTTPQQPHNNPTDSTTRKPSNGAGYSDNNPIGKMHHFRASAKTGGNNPTHQVSGNQESIPKGIDIISKKPAIRLLEEFGICGDLATDFVTHRKNKKAAITKTVMDGFRREAAAAGIAITEAIRESIERGWTGFKADWHKQLSYKSGQGNGKYSISTEDIERAF